MKRKQGDTFEDYHINFAKQYGLSEEHLGVIINSYCEGLRYYLSSPEAPALLINNFGTFRVDITKLMKVLHRLCRDYYNPDIPKAKKILIRDRFIQLNEIKRRRKAEKFTSRKTKKHNNGKESISKLISWSGK